MVRFDPPGFENDFRNAGDLQQWSDWISQRLDEAAAGEPAVYDFDAPRPRFFNPLTTPPAADAVEKDIAWKAFPRIVEIESGSDLERWETADTSRDVQDEYCEWSVTRDPITHKIKKVTFTSEGPEYWRFLAAVDMPRVLELYKKHVSARVELRDLVFGNGTYNPRNRWNSSTVNGAMHLIQTNNTLSAEIELAAGATNVRSKQGRILTDPRELIDCGGYGARERHSDPHIGAEVNSLARQDADLTLANPVGLCIASLNTAGWETPNQSPPLDYWTITRGTKEKALRAVYEVPESAGFTVSDIKINGQPIRYGAQIADCISIKLTGLATRIGQHQEPPLTDCKRRKPGGPGVAKPTIAQVLAWARHVTR